MLDPVADAGEAGAVPAPGEALFVDRTVDAGLAGFVHFSGATNYRHLIETMGGGVGLLDYNDDGWLDAYLVESAPLPEGEAPAIVPTNRLLRGSAEGVFEDRSRESGTDDPGFGMGCAVGDVDNDGRLDLYVLNVGANRLFMNVDGERFSETAEAAGVAGESWSVSAGFFDAERDGDLDLYVVNYVLFSREGQQRLFRDQGGRAFSYPHPDLFDAAADGFFRNDGSGRFDEASAEAGFGSAVPGKGLGVAFADVEGDGDVDVYVANDSTPNFLFLNAGEEGTARFEESAALSGCAYNQDGQTEASMGVDFGDADGDGFPEIFMTHLDIESNTLYANLGDAVPEFDDHTRRSRLGPPSVKLTGFGTAFFDYDSDGALDLFVVNGHIIDNIAEIYPDRTYAQRDLLFHGRGDGTFDNLSGSGGPHFARETVGRGLALGDIDNDGDSDVLIGHCGQPPILLENRATGERHWIRFQLRAGPQSGELRDPLGARVRVTAGERTQTEELWRAYSYASSSEAAVHFGLGEYDRVELVEVRWPSGAVETWSDLAANRRYALERGRSEAIELP